MRGLPHSRALLPLIPPTPSSHKGRRGSLGVLMPETEDDTQGIPKKPAPVSIRGAVEQECILIDHDLISEPERFLKSMLYY